MATKAQKVTFAEVAAPATPAAGEVVTYAKADGLVYSKDDAGTETLLSSGAAATRASLGLATSDSPEFAALNVGAATDTTITRTGAGEIAVEGNRIFRVGGADVPIADGGTGASTKAAAFDALSPMTTQDDIIIGGASGTGTRLAKGSDGQVLTVDPTTHHLLWATPSASGSVATDTIWNAKGDLAGGTGSDTAARLAVGTNGQVLTADSGETTGMKWAAAGGGGGLTSAYLGYNTVGGTEESATVQVLYAKQVTPAADCVLQTVELYTRETTDSLQILSVVLYEDNSGALGKILANAISQQLAFTNNATFGGGTASVARWFGVPLSYKLTGSTPYWIGWFWTTSGSPTPRQFYDGSGTDRSYTSGGAFIADGGRYSESSTTKKYSVRALTIA